jgi:hypothetical protein
MLYFHRRFRFILCAVLTLFSAHNYLQATNEFVFNAFLSGEKISANLPRKTDKARSDYSYYFYEEPIEFRIDVDEAPDGNPDRILNEILEDHEFESDIFKYQIHSSNFGEWNGFPTLDICEDEYGDFISRRYILTPTTLYCLNAYYSSKDDFQFSSFDLLQDDLPIIHSADISKSHLRATFGKELMSHEFQRHNNYNLCYCVDNDFSDPYDRNIYLIAAFTTPNIENPKVYLEKVLNSYKNSSDDLNTYQIKFDKGYWTLDMEFTTPKSSETDFMHMVVTNRQVIEIWTFCEDKSESIHDKIVQSLKIEQL